MAHVHKPNQSLSNVYEVCSANIFILAIGSEIHETRLQRLFEHLVECGFSLL